MGISLNVCAKYLVFVFGFVVFLFVEKSNCVILSVINSLCANLFDGIGVCCDSCISINIDIGSGLFCRYPKKRQHS